MQLIRRKKLKQIFSDHWENFVNKHQGQIRPAIHKNVAKMLRCGTEEAGFHLYRCPQCGAEKKVPHTCKSRFCPSCGVGQTERWIEQYTILFANTVYRHIIFHPPSEFRPYFGVGKTVYYNMLYATVNQALADWYQRKGFIPGIMAVLHTFGRDEKFTPHIHALMSTSASSAMAGSMRTGPEVPSCPKSLPSSSRIMRKPKKNWLTLAPGGGDRLHALPNLTR